jgi:acyl carrier protein
MTTSLPSDPLELIRQVLPEYVDIAPADITPETELAAIGADSLTLAELLFTLEDRVGHDIGEAQQLPTHVRDLVALLQPHLGQLRLQGAA